MSKIVLVLSILVMSVQVFARGGDELLNGGDGLVCVFGNYQRYELLDLHEGRVLHGFSYERADNVDSALNRVFGLLRKKDISRACLYRNWLKTFWEESRLIYSSFPNVRDEGYHVVHPNCWVEQVALRAFRALPDSKRYLISGKFYNSMSSNDQAALVLHELSYREGRLVSPMRFSNSQKIRKYIAYIFSRSMINDSQATYDRIVREVGLPETENYCDPNHKIYKTH